MFEYFLLAGIMSVMIAGIWALARFRRLLAKDVAAGTVRSEILSAVRLAPTVLVLCNFLFVLPLPMRLLFTTSIVGGISPNLDVFINYFPLALLLNALFIFLFTIAFCWRVQRVRRTLCIMRVTSRWPRGVLLFVGLTWLGVSLLLVAMLAQKSGGGIMDLVLQGYGVTENFNDNGIYAIGLTWFGILPIFLLAYAGGRKKITALFLIACGLIAVNILALIIMGRRGELVFLGLSVLIVWNFAYHPLSKKKLILLLIAGFLALNLLGMVRGQSYTSIASAANVMSELVQERSGEGLESYTYTLTTGQFAVPFSSFPEIIAHMGDQIPYWWGGASLGSIALIVPTALWPDRPSVLSNWYMREFYDPEAAGNVGRQFFILTAPYMDFGVFGIILFGLLCGILFAQWVIVVSLRLNNPIYMTLFALSVGYGLSWMTNDILGGAIAFLKTSLPLIVIVAAGILLRTSGRRSGHKFSKD